MGRYSKDKGTGYEREFCEKLAEAGIPAERTWGSDGRSRGLHREVDVVIRDRLYVQSKRPGSLPDYLFPSDREHLKFLKETSTDDEYAVLWLNPHYVQLLNGRPIAPKAETFERSRIGDDWKPSRHVVAQAMRQDYDTSGDLVVLRKPSFLTMIRAVARSLDDVPYE